MNFADFFSSSKLLHKIFLIVPFFPKLDIKPLEIYIKSVSIKFN